MVAAADIIAPALAGADEDAEKACPRAGRRPDPWSAARGLAHLDVDILVVERDRPRRRSRRGSSEDRTVHIWLTPNATTSGIAGGFDAG